MHRVYQCIICCLWKKYNLEGIVMIFPNLICGIVTKKAQLWTWMLLWYKCYQQDLPKIAMRLIYLLHNSFAYVFNSRGQITVLYSQKYTKRPCCNLSTLRDGLWPFWKSNMEIMVPRSMSSSNIDYSLKTILLCFIDCSNVGCQQ